MSNPFDGPIGLIVNPRSKRNRDRLERVRAVCRAADRLLVREIDDVTEIPETLSSFAQAGVTLVAVAGGDGTVQATMTALIEGKPFVEVPPLTVLAGGMTNVTGHHVGIPGKPDRSLAALLRLRAAGGSPTLRRHPVMAVRAHAGASPQFGMLLGGAAFYDGTMIARRSVHPVGFAQSAAAGVAGLAFYFRTLLGSAGPGHRMSIAIDGDGGPNGPCYFFLISCLAGLILGLDPFWGDGDGPLRWTFVRHPPRRIAIAAAPLLLGRPFDWMTRDGYHSGRATRIEIESETPLLFDGETIETRPGRPVIVESGREMTFAQL